MGSLLAVGALAATTSAGATAATFGTQGVAAGSGVSQGKVDRELDQAKRTGAKLIRVEAAWSQLQPSGPGAPDSGTVAALDRVTEAARRRNMKVILQIASTPCWASSYPDKGDCSQQNGIATTFQPSDAETVVPISVFLVKRYADSLAAFQLWNEPDQANQKYFAGPDKVQKYVAMAKALYPALKQAEPKVQVLAGSFVGSDGRWLSALYDAGMKGSYDGLAVQFYSQTLASLRKTRSVQRAHGDSKKLWLTEFGYTDCYRRGGPRRQIDQPCYSKRGAARGLRDVLTALRTRRYVAAALPFKLYDDPPGGYTFGLYDVRGKAKATYRAVRRVLTGKDRRPVRPELRLRRSRGKLIASGTASVTEFITVTVRKSGSLRYRATLTADRLNRFRIVLPSELGTRNLKVRVSAGYTGSRTARI